MANSGRRVVGRGFLPFFCVRKGTHNIHLNRAVCLHTCCLDSASVRKKNTTKHRKNNAELLGQPCRHFFKPPDLNPFSSKQKAYSERRLLGYSMEQMFDIVADVQQYTEFVPWCIGSDVVLQKPGCFRANLAVGFPPLIERYVAVITTAKPNLVRSEATEGKLFNYLLTTWRFSPGLPNRPDTCTLDFAVSFEFRSTLHSKIATMFFDEVVKTMVNSFLKRAEKLHGPQAIQNQKPKILNYQS